MALSVGIVGLPNVGKSTLFNALLKKQQAYAANFPFATIEPNVGVVPVPDERLAKLAEVVATGHPEHSEGSEILKQVQNDTNLPQNDGRAKRPPEVPATVEFVDIAGLIAGAHKGEGLGNKFLAHIRETNAVVHVVRAFTNPEILRHESVDSESESGMTKNDPKRDLEIVETELMMADLATLENQKSKIKGQKDNLKLKSFVEKSENAVRSGIPVRSVDFDKEEQKEGKQLGLLTAKPILVALNVDEEALKNADIIEKDFAEKVGLNIDQVIAINAKTEEELAGFSESEAREYLKDLGVEETGLRRLIQKAFSTLGLITFLTAGVKEVRAWTIKNSFTAPEAAGAIHTDFEKKFIMAEIVDFNDFIQYGGWKGAKVAGKVRQEGKNYIIKEGDIINFKIGA